MLGYLFGVFPRMAGKEGYSDNAPALLGPSQNPGISLTCLAPCRSWRGGSEELSGVKGSSPKLSWGLHLRPWTCRGEKATDHP